MTHARRQFLLCLTASMAATGVGVVAAQPVLPAAVLESDPFAQALAYKANTTLVDAHKHARHRPDQQCSNCHFFQGKAGDTQGPCPMLAGRQVAARGWCVAYERRGSASLH